MSHPSIHPSIKQSLLDSWIIIIIIIITCYCYYYYPIPCHAITCQDRVFSIGSNNDRVSLIQTNRQTDTASDGGSYGDYIKDSEAVSM
jgi:hypothetical protein